MARYLVRIGALGEIVVAKAMIDFRPNRRIILRSNRGIEIAEIVAPYRREPAPETDFRIVRPTTDADERLAKRLQRHKREAIEACRLRLNESGSDAILLDVDQFLDGATLKMHFLGDIAPEMQTIVDEVAQQYERVVKTDHLAELLREGCGTDCGSNSGGGCVSCSGCATRP